jgi:hypothetical protein
MNFIIPSKLQLGGTDIEVKVVEKCSEADCSADGMAYYGQSRIELVHKKEYSQSYKEWVFFHELVHQIFYHMDEDALRSNENLVNRFATFLHQAIKSME